MLLNVFFLFLIYLKPHRGKDPLDLFGPGSLLELQHSQGSLGAWPVRVLDNIGGRLQLQYEGALDWPSLQYYYLHPSLHQMGWAAQNGYEIKPPEGNGYYCFSFNQSYVW